MINLKVINEDNFLDAFQLKLADEQERGYGSEALRLVLEYIKTKPFGDSNRVTLTCNKDNQVALKVYHKAGFVETGEEEILRLFYLNYAS